MSYTIEQNILNQGSMAGKYALKDLSNTGKYSGFLNKIPVRRNVTHEVDASGLHKVTVGNGSLFTIPNGITETDSSARDCEYTRISRDFTITVRFAGGASDEAKDASRFVYVLYDRDDNCLIAARGGADYPAKDPSINGIVTTLEKVTISYAYYTVKVNGHRCSLPIGYFDGALKWHTFDAVGFVDSLFWVEEDVEGIFSEGKDFTSNYKCSRVSTSWLTFTKFTASDAKVIPTRAKCIALLKSGKVRAVPACESRDTFTDITADDEAGYYLVLDENNEYYKASVNSNALEKVTNVVKLCDFTFDDNNRFTGISNMNMYKPVTIAPVESKVNKLDQDVKTLKDLWGDITADELLNKKKGGVITGKTEYTMSGQEGSSELVNLTYVNGELGEYAPLAGAAFSGKVTVPMPEKDSAGVAIDNGDVANVGWVKAEIQNSSIGKASRFAGVISGTYDNTRIDTSVFTQANFVDMFNKLACDFGRSPLTLAVNTWYQCNIPCWVQWNSSEAYERNALRLGDNPSNYYLVAQVAAWGKGDSCASAVLVPVAAGQWLFNYRHASSNCVPVARIFPMKGYTNSLNASALKRNNAYNINYYSID